MSVDRMQDVVDFAYQLTTSVFGFSPRMFLTSLWVAVQWLFSLLLLAYLSTLGFLLLLSRTCREEGSLSFCVGKFGLRSSSLPSPEDVADTARAAITVTQAVQPDVLGRPRGQANHRGGTRVGRAGPPPRPLPVRTPPVRGPPPRTPIPRPMPGPPYSDDE